MMATRIIETVTVNHNKPDCIGIVTNGLNKVFNMVKYYNAVKGFNLEEPDGILIEAGIVPEIGQAWFVTMQYTKQEFVVKTTIVANGQVLIQKGTWDDENGNWKSMPHEARGVFFINHFGPDFKLVERKPIGDAVCKKLNRVELAGCVSEEQGGITLKEGCNRYSLPKKDLLRHVMMSNVLAHVGYTPEKAGKLLEEMDFVYQPAQSSSEFVYIATVNNRVCQLVLMINEYGSFTIYPVKPMAVVPPMMQVLMTPFPQTTFNTCGKEIMGYLAADDQQDLAIVVIDPDFGEKRIVYNEFKDTVADILKGAKIVGDFIKSAAVATMPAPEEIPDIVYDPRYVTLDDEVLIETYFKHPYGSFSSKIVSLNKMIAGLADDIRVETGISAIIDTKCDSVEITDIKFTADRIMAAPFTFNITWVFNPSEAFPNGSRVTLALRGKFSIVRALTGDRAKTLTFYYDDNNTDNTENKENELAHKNERIGQWEVEY